MPVIKVRGNFFCFCQKSTVGGVVPFDLYYPGLCSGSSFDAKYSWTTDLVEGRYSFRGYRDTLLHFDAGLQAWKMDLYTTNKTYAVANVTDYPFGNQEWEVYNDECFGPGEAVTVVLNMNACNDSEFNCDSGLCIPMELRCNGNIDCEDNSGICQIMSYSRFLTDLKYSR